VTQTANPPFNELQKQLYVALNGNITAGVYDNVPEDQTKPWATVGEIIALPDNQHDSFGWDVLATIHVWTKSLGFKPALDVAYEIIPILDHKRSAIALPDPWSITGIRFVQLSTLRDPDPEIRHVPVQFRILINQEV